MKHDLSRTRTGQQRKEVANLHRLLGILTHIRARQEWTPGALAGEFKVTARTIHRDVDKLRTLGFPIIFDRARGAYRIQGECFLPPMQLTFEEALALTVLCEDVAGLHQITMLGPAYRALSKIEAQLPHDVRDQLSTVMDHVSIRTGPAEPEEPVSDVHAIISQAMATRTALRCTYASPRSNGLPALGAEFFFEPYALFFSVRAWYVVGRHAGKAEIRCLKLSRFTSITLARRAYRLPESFSLSEHLGNAWRMIRGRPDYDVELHFDAEFAHTVAETRWHPTQQLEHREDGSLIFRCRVSGLDEIVWWVLSMGPHCRVVQPPELARRTLDLARATAALYEPVPTPTTARKDRSSRRNGKVTSATTSRTAKSRASRRG